MGLFTNPNHVNTPPGWPVCDRELGESGGYKTPKMLGFVGETGDLNRFRSRYRVAKSFKEISLESYNPETADGYSALFKIFLTYSAFEQLLYITGLTIDGFEPLLNQYDPISTARQIKTVDGHDKFLKFILSQLDRAKHRNQVEFFLNDKESNILYIPAGIRHIFAHGILTPNSGNENVEPAKQMSNILCSFLFRVMDGEFVSRLRSSGIAV